MNVDTLLARGRAGTPALARCERLRGVEPGSASSWRLLRRFVERAKDEGAAVAQCDQGPIAIEWPDGTWVAMTGAAFGAGAPHERSQAVVH